jgi:hypothetical protein
MPRGTIHIWDERFEDGPRHVKDLHDIPEELLGREVMQRYGIASHLSVYEYDETGKKSTINHGIKFGE